MVAAALSGCGGGGSSGDAPPAETVGQVVTSSLRSASGYDYPLQIYLPQSYATGSSTLPVIYATEGDALYGPGRNRFESFKEAMQRRGTQAILVGIGGTERRAIDFLLPSASAYLSFITQTLAPSIERQYRADPKRRALSGLSHGGYFVVAALMLQAQAGVMSFSHHLSTDSSYGGHADPQAYLAFEKQIDGKPLPTTLFLAGAKDYNGPIVAALYTQMAAQVHSGLTLLHAEYNTSHVGADAPAFEEALTRFYA